MIRPAQPPSPSVPAAAPAAETPRPPEIGAWHPLRTRLKLLIVLLTLATVAILFREMLKPPLELLAAKVARGDAALRLACPPGAASATAGCPGGTMAIQVLPVRALPAR